jgi:hypothetical protein
MEGFIHSADADRHYMLSGYDYAVGQDVQLPESGNSAEHIQDITCMGYLQPVANRQYAHLVRSDCFCPDDTRDYYQCIYP